MMRSPLNQHTKPYSFYYQLAARRGLDCKVVTESIRGTINKHVCIWFHGQWQPQRGISYQA